TLKFWIRRPARCTIYNRTIALVDGPRHPLPDQSVNVSKEPLKERRPLRRRCQVRITLHRVGHAAPIRAIEGQRRLVRKIVKSLALSIERRTDHRLFRTIGIDSRSTQRSSCELLGGTIRLHAGSPTAEWDAGCLLLNSAEHLRPGYLTGREIG